MRSGWKINCRIQKRSRLLFVNLNSDSTEGWLHDCVQGDKNVLSAFVWRNSSAKPCHCDQSWRSLQLPFRLRVDSWCSATVAATEYETSLRYSSISIKLSCLPLTERMLDTMADASESSARLAIFGTFCGIYIWLIIYTLPYVLFVRPAVYLSRTAETTPPNVYTCKELMMMIIIIKAGIITYEAVRHNARPPQKENECDNNIINTNWSTRT